MATQANSYDGFEAAEGMGGAPPRTERTDMNRVRALPNEDIYFYRKSFDNSGVVRLPDPVAGARCWRRVAVTTAGTVALAAFFWPALYGMLSGYQIEQLRRQQERLIAENTSLEVDEARMMSPERLQQLAPGLEFSDPSPGQVVFLNPKPDGSLAFNSKSK
jgi:hypothetical protein